MWFFIYLQNVFKRGLQFIITYSRNILFIKPSTPSIVTTSTTTSATMQGPLVTQIRQVTEEAVTNDSTVAPKDKDKENAKKELKEWIETKIRGLSNIGSTMGVPFFFENQTGRFRIEYIEFYWKDTAHYEMTVYYVILGASHEHQKTIEQTHLSSVDSILCFVLRILLLYTVCPNCLHLFDQKQSCEYCLPYRVVAQLTHPHDIQNCCICFEPVYGPILGCGHVVHNLCLLRMNPLDSFDPTMAFTIPRKCPICRRRLTMNDHARVFLLPNSVLAKLYK